MTPGSVEIASDTHPGQTYVVEVNARGEAWYCTCPSWQFRRPTGGCKHMRQVQNDLELVAHYLAPILAGLDQPEDSRQNPSE